MQHLLSDFLTEKGILLDLGLLRKILTIFFRNSKKLEQDFNYLVPSSALHKKSSVYCRTLWRFLLYLGLCRSPWSCDPGPSSLTLGPRLYSQAHSMNLGIHKFVTSFLPLIQFWSGWLDRQLWFENNPV